MWIWQARASNNSGDWTIVGRFESADQAEKVAQSLRELARAHEAFLASPEGHAWLEQNEYHGGIPTPPLQVFGERHGFDWSVEGEGLWWEEDGAGAPVLTVGAVGDSVVVYHPYCMGLPEQPFKQFFAKTGATEFGYWQYSRPRVVATAIGRKPAAIASLRDYLTLTQAAKYPSDVKLPPPWGDECGDPRVWEDEDRNARLADGNGRVEQDGNHLRLTLAFENTLAGALALQRWLEGLGYKEVVITIEAGLNAIGQRAQPRTEPQTDLFGDVRPLANRLIDASAEEIVELIFAYHSDLPKPLSEALLKIPLEPRLQLCRQRWQQERDKGRDVNWQALLIIQRLGPVAGDWMRTIWKQLLAEGCKFEGVAIKSLAASLPPDEAFELAEAWAEQATEPADKKERLMAFWSLGQPRTLGLIERWWESARPNEAVSNDWGRLAAESRMSWSAAQTWLDRGRPLSLIALDALLYYLPRPGYGQIIVSDGFGFPSLGAFQDVLNRYCERDRAPRALNVVAQLIENANLLTR